MRKNRAALDWRNAGSSAVLSRLRSMANPSALAGMERFALPTRRALGISTPRLKALAKEIGKCHALAEALWSSGIHEGSNSRG